MAFEYHIHHDLRLTYRKIWGEYTTEGSIAAHHRWDELSSEGEIGRYDELSDLSEVTDYTVSIDQIHRLATRYRHITVAEKEAGIFKPKKIAYVIPSALAYGTGRVYGALVGDTGLNFKVFSDMSEACGWLGLSAQAVKNILLKKLD